MIEPYVRMETRSRCVSGQKRKRTRDHFDVTGRPDPGFTSEKDRGDKKENHSGFSTRNRFGQFSLLAIQKMYEWCIARRIRKISCLENILFTRSFKNQSTFYLKQLNGTYKDNL